MKKVYRIFVEKRKEYAVEALEVLTNLKTQLKICKESGIDLRHVLDCVKEIFQEVKP